jgi:hypothetical protein
MMCKRNLDYVEEFKEVDNKAVSSPPASDPFAHIRGYRIPRKSQDEGEEQKPNTAGDEEANDDESASYRPKYD